MPLIDAALLPIQIIQIIHVNSAGVSREQQIITTIIANIENQTKVTQKGKSLISVLGGFLLWLEVSF